MSLSSQETSRKGSGMKRSQQRKLSLSVLTILTLVLGLLAAPAGAQSVSDNRVDFEVLQADVRTQNGNVVIRPAAGAEATDIVVEIEGEEIIASTAPIFRSDVQTYTVLVVDDSANGDSIAGFSTIRESALAYLSGLSANTQVMLVRAGGGRLNAPPVVDFTSDHGAVRAAINAMEPSGGDVTLNAISNAAGEFSGVGDGLRQVVAFVGSPGSSSTVTATATQGRLLGASASFTLVAPRTNNLDISEFASIADNLRGGAVFRGTSADSNMVVAAQNAVATHQSYLVGTFPTNTIIDYVAAEASGGSGTNELTASYGGSSERVRIVPTGLVTGASLDAPIASASSRFDILNGNLVALIAIALIVIAVLLFAFTLMQILVGSDNTLNSTLSVYGGDARTEDQSAADDAFASQRARIIEQVVERAEEAAEARGNLNSTSYMLEKAEIPLRVGEAFAIQGGIVIFAFILGFFIFGTSLIGGLILSILGLLIPPAYVRHKVGKRGKKIEAQLPDTLILLASTLKAGYSFLQGIDAVANEAEEPLAGEFRRTVNEARLGKEMDEALDDLAVRVDSQDMLWAIVAIKIQREVGGNLAELLTIVAETMTSRQRLRGEVKSLTAEGRVSAYILLALPFLVALAMYFINSDYLSELWTNTLGLVAVGVSLISMTIGGYWMKKIVDIEL